MNRTILYYPTINIPKNSWLRHALLYWDEVSSIVPQSWDERILIELSPDIHYLMDEGQFRPIKPEDLITKTDNWVVYEDFQNEFMEIVASPDFNNFRRRVKSYSHSRIHSNKVVLDSRIHSNKTSNGILDYLEEHGLARRDFNSEWIMFERNTALLYMSLLAKYLADIDSNHTTIGTDFAAYEKFNFMRVNDNNGFPVVSFNLDRILPTPKNNVPFERIIDFKRRRADNLRHFKRILSDFQSNISDSQSNSEIKEIAVNFQETLASGVEDLAAVLSDSRIAHTVKSFRSLISLKSPTTLTAIGSIVNSQTNFFNIPVDLNIAGIAIMGAVEITTNYIDSRNMQRARIRENPFSYIYYAHRYGILENPRR